MEELPGSWCLLIPEASLRALASSQQADLDTINSNIKEGQKLEEAQAQKVSVPPKLQCARKLKRLIYDSATGTEDLPGVLRLSEDDYMTQNQQVYNFFNDVFQFKLLDGTGTELQVTMDYPGKTCVNAYWTGTQMVLGSGSDETVSNFHEAEDVLVHEMVHGIIAHTSRLKSCDQPGALAEHLADLFGITYRQYT
ncbi:zincin [Microthyrium microscopicum]|uniref:Zincin n=1 Tax=Microthyrium microscopicum TaxID=703497 RepID=A0A6A6U5C1_9PEZI|nr:zincin [Microthyrium microscopicum]